MRGAYDAIAFVCAVTNICNCGQIVSEKEKMEESVSERRKRKLLTRHPFVLKMFAGIGCESGFVSVAKEKLLALVAIAKRKLAF